MSSSPPQSTTPRSSPRSSPPSVPSVPSTATNGTDKAQKFTSKIPQMSSSSPSSPKPTVKAVTPSSNVYVTTSNSKITTKFPQFQPKQQQSQKPPSPKQPKKQLKQKQNPSSSSKSSNKMIFYDMKSSNNASRIRLWLEYNKVVKETSIVIEMMNLSTLKSQEFAKINPLRKVPALIRHDGVPVYESNVILNYLEHKYNNYTKYVPTNPEDRQVMDLMIRLHDLYISSPNSTMPGFTHTQGCLYLPSTPNEWYAASRCITDVEVRAKKVQELWEQLSRLNDMIIENDDEDDEKVQYLLGKQLSLADFTWYATTIYIEYLTPRVIGWDQNVVDTLFFTGNELTEDILSQSPLPKLTKWWNYVTTTQKPFARVRKDILEGWKLQYENGILDDIRKVVEENSTKYQWKYPIQWNVPFQATLHYQEEMTEQDVNIGKRQIGRYVSPNGDEPDILLDVHKLQEVSINDGRELQNQFDDGNDGTDGISLLDVTGFRLVEHSSKVLQDLYKDDNETTPFLSGDKNTREIYYEEMRDLIKQQTGCRYVHIFDHTLRTSDDNGSGGSTNLNASNDSSVAVTVNRVHCDYTATSAPKRLHQLWTAALDAEEDDEEENGENGNSIRNTLLDAFTQHHMNLIVNQNYSKRFAFINVWRSIDVDSSVLQKPLAVCDCRSVNYEEDLLLYELHFPERVGENYSIKYNPNHQWYVYSQMTHEECLLFKVFDSETIREEKVVIDTASEDANADEGSKEDTGDGNDAGEGSGAKGDDDEGYEEAVEEKMMARFVFHTAVDDPRGGFKAPPRQSIEIRAIAVW